MNSDINIKVVNIRENEQAMKVIHRNSYYVIQQFLIAFGLMAVFFAAIFFVPVFFPTLFGKEMDKFFVFLQTIMLLAFWNYVFLIWIDYYFDIWIITNERLINIEQKGLFSRRVSELEYSRIQDVTVTVSGLTATILNYGDITVQTAAELDNFVFRTISDPYRIKDLILNLQHTSDNK